MIFQYYIHVFQNYANFEGRARRSEYWYFVLFQTIIALTILALFVSIFESFSPYIYGIYMLVSIIPSLAVAVRKLHDIGKSGFYILVYFIPLVGGIWLLVMLCTDSDEGENEYGPNPKNIGNDASDYAQIETIGQ